MSFTVKGNNSLKFFFPGWSGAEEVSFKMHLGNLGKFFTFPGICMAKTCSLAFISNCHGPTPTFSILHLVNNKCKTEYHSLNFRT